MFRFYCAAAPQEMLEKKAAYLEKQMDEELTKAKQLQAAGKKNQVRQSAVPQRSRVLRGPLRLNL